MSRISKIWSVAALATIALVAGAFVTGASHAFGGAGCFKVPGVRDGSGVTVSLKGFCFEPLVLHIDAGQSVTWTNADGTGHQVVGAGSEWGLTRELAPGEAYTYKFDKAGVYPYTCLLHWGMTGAVLVGSGATATRDENPAKAAAIVPAQAAAADSAPAASQSADGGDTDVALFAGLGLAAGLVVAGAPLGWLVARHRR